MSISQSTKPGHPGRFSTFQSLSALQLNVLSGIKCSNKFILYNLGVVFGVVAITYHVFCHFFITMILAIENVWLNREL